MRKNKVLIYLAIAIMVAVVVVIFLWVVLRLFHVSSSISNGDAIVLAFFGILATFVVVGNYSQVLNIKAQMEDKLRDIENKFDKRIDKIKIDEPDEKMIDTIKHQISATIYGLTKNDTRVLDLQQFILELLNFKHHEVLLSAFLDLQTPFDLELGDNSTLTAIASIENDKLIFSKVDTGTKVSKKITKISNNDFNIREANKIVTLYVKLKENPSLPEIF